MREREEEREGKEKERGEEKGKREGDGKEAGGIRGRERQGSGQKERKVELEMMAHGIAEALIGGRIEKRKEGSKLGN